jgi:hypothetical protein
MKKKSEVNDKKKMDVECVCVMMHIFSDVTEQAYLIMSFAYFALSRRTAARRGH